MPSLSPPGTEAPVPAPKPAATTPVKKPGDAAYAVAQQQLNKPYGHGATGPDSFDCSGLMYYSYLHGPGMNIGRDTTAQWNNQVNLTTVYDAFAAGTTGHAPNPITADQLEVGDLLLYFIPGNSGDNAHVKMYAGNGQTIEAPHTGAVVTMNPVDLKGDASEPLRGVKRPVGGGSANSPPSSTGDGQTANDKNWDKYQTAYAAVYQTLKDPKDNLPFSAYFMGKSQAKFYVGAKTSDLGGIKIPGGPDPTINPQQQLVRGGMAELVANMFKVYFMVNPEEIAVNCGIDNSQPPATSIAADAFLIGSAWVSNQTVAFTLYFNRMYEVWQGGVPGPSDIGCRWDIRALERLLGVFDATAGTGGTAGSGNHGAGARQPSVMPVQVVFGGPNSYQFQGSITTLNYNYTMFDSNMIPLAAEADIQVMRVYHPQMLKPNIVSSLIQPTGQTSTQKVPSTSPKSTFNTPITNKS